MHISSVSIISTASTIKDCHYIHLLLVKEGMIPTEIAYKHCHWVSNGNTNYCTDIRQPKVHMLKIQKGTGNVSYTLMTKFSNVVDHFLPYRFIDIWSAQAEPIVCVSTKWVIWICFAAFPSRYPSTCLKPEWLEHRIGGEPQQTWLAASTGTTLHDYADHFGHGRKLCLSSWGQLRWSTVKMAVSVSSVQRPVSRQGHQLEGAICWEMTQLFV